MTYHQDAPGCFGSALTYKGQSLECSTCFFALQCAPLHEQSLAKIRASLGIVLPAPPRKMTPRTPVIANGASLVAVLPKKVELLLNYMNDKGIRVAESLKNKVNPFGATDRPAFMRIICHVLLRIQNGVPETLLRQALMTKLNWSEGTAVAHVTQARQVLLALNVARFQNGVLELKQNMNG